MAIQNVAIVGSSGSLGAAVFARLKGAFTVTILARESSKSAFPQDVKVVRVSDAFPVDELAAALRGQDAVVVTIGGNNEGEQIRLADAAAKAGVRRFIPADFGSCDSESERARQLIRLYERKRTVRSHLVKLAEETGGAMSWTGIVCGHFFDWCVQHNFIHLDFERLEAGILDDGTRKWSATTLDTIGLAVVRVLQLEEQTRNRVLFIQSFCVSQNDVLEKAEKITGKKWQVEHLDSREFIKEQKKKADAGDKQAIEELVFAQGLLDSNWEEREDFANELLGLENEDLEQVIRTAIGQISR